MADDRNDIPPDAGPSPELLGKLLIVFVAVGLMRSAWPPADIARRGGGA